MATPGRPLPQQDRERIVKLRENGLSIRAVASAVHVSQVTVQKILKRPLAK